MLTHANSFLFFLATISGHHCHQGLTNKDGGGGIKSNRGGIKYEARPIGRRVFVHLKICSHNRTEFPDAHTIYLNYSSLLVGLLNCVQYPHRADLWSSLPVGKQCCVHVMVFIKICHIYLSIYLSIYLCVYVCVYVCVCVCVAWECPYVYIYIYTGHWPRGLECSPMARETWVQSHVESYQRLKKWYLMPPCLTLSIMRYGSRVK